MAKPDLQRTVRGAVSDSNLPSNVNAEPTTLTSVRAEATEVKGEQLLSGSPEVGCSAP